jgi:hypothetical protein
MKKYILTTAILICFSIYSFSQKIVDKKVEVNGNEVVMKLSFADDIKIEAWNKNYIELKAKVNIDENKFNDKFSLDIENEGSVVKIIENIDFEAIKKARKKSGDKNENSWDTDLNYSLKVPASLVYSLKSISGDIEIIDCVGEMNISTVSGFIDYSVSAKQKAGIKVSTISGEVYSDLEFDNEPSQKISWVGTNRKLNLNGGGTAIKLKSVSGNIYLRKK